LQSFGPIALEHRSLVEERLAKYPPEISEHTFANLFIWRASRPIEVLDTGDSLLMVEPCENGVVLLGRPIGTLPLSEAIRAVESLMAAPLLAIERLSEHGAEEARAAGLETQEERTHFDYVYRREALAALSGRNFHAKRNLIAQCLAEHQCTYEEITPTNLAEVRAMMQRWCAAHGCGKEPGLCSEYLAVQELLDHAGDLAASGAAIRVDGHIEAFTFGERLTPSTAVIHFEKATAGIKGLYQLINQWFCKNHLTDFEFINREQDLGIEGLRRAKESYFPDHLVKKFSVFPHGQARSTTLTRPPIHRCSEVDAL
jgi:uncharacterized protein